MDFEPVYPVTYTGISENGTNVARVLKEHFELGYEPIFTPNGYYAGSGYFPQYQIALDLKDSTIKYDDAINVYRNMPVDEFGNFSEEDMLEFNEEVQAYLDDGWILAGTVIKPIQGESLGQLLYHPVEPMAPIDEGVAKIYIQPEDFECTEGDTAVFRIVNGGELPVQHRWQEYINGVWHEIPQGNGAQTDTYTVPNVPLIYNNRTYRCEVMNKYGTDYSDPCQLIVEPCNINQYDNYNLYVGQDCDRYGYDLVEGLGALRTNSVVRHKPLELTAEGNTTRLSANYTLKDDGDVGQYFIRIEGSPFLYNLYWDNENICFDSNFQQVADLIRSANGSYISVYLQYWDTVSNLPEWFVWDEDAQMYQDGRIANLPEAE